jgi:branched-subunit amino acid aminotransferase/4-amino-4-deoxychorismate lyase
MDFAPLILWGATRKGNCRKVSIMDWDIHYGQGVAEIIEGYPDIRYVSMHQVPAFLFFHIVHSSLLFASCQHLARSKMQHRQIKFHDLASLLPLIMCEAQ